jgi:hypothetical protein
MFNKLNLFIRPRRKFLFFSFSNVVLYRGQRVFIDTLITLSNLESDAKATLVKYEMVIK